MRQRLINCFLFIDTGDTVILNSGKTFMIKNRLPIGIIIEKNRGKEEDVRNKIKYPEKMSTK